jgi:pyrrolidone-carboxylate peptidase
MINVWIGMTRLIIIKKGGAMLVDLISLKNITILSLLCLTINISARASMTVEEDRISKARNEMPDLFESFRSQVNDIKSSCKKKDTYARLSACVENAGIKIWESAKNQISSTLDDRPLYWNRLILTQFLRNAEFDFEPSSEQRLDLIERLENSSRGRTKLVFKKGLHHKILLTGFDPFLLDRHIDQSNPSGVAALMLDDKSITFGDIKAEIKTVLFPVRFDDFDAGELESLLRPFYQDGSIDMIVTVSMGRENFDLEHYPGRRRSSEAPDNLNQYSGGSAKNPIVPMLKGGLLEGAEFYEFSLPYAAIMKAEKDSPYKINDRRIVSTLEGSETISSLSQLKNAIAVRGGGGGYLSNEISYRSVRLASLYQSDIRTGHIHTPRIVSFNKKEIKDIVEQLEKMIRYSLDSLESEKR